ncbi:MAG: hypothetical protein QOK23_638 [Gammaproteobacteria bacterium]|jgi:hypothetical protein|nr:hypothetical protein [Gammaproteobacteria bacterium]
MQPRDRGGEANAEIKRPFLTGEFQDMLTQSETVDDSIHFWSTVRK